MTPEEAEFEKPWRALAEATDADILFYCGPINQRGDRRVTSLVASKKNKRKNLYLFLTTEGGDPDCAYRIARTIQRAYAAKGGKFTLLVDWYCKSAGTLLAIGADEVVMSDDAELGPLDVQLLKPDELWSVTSGLTSFKALETLRSLVYADFIHFFLEMCKRPEGQITTKTAADIATNLTVGLYGGIYSQVDPMQIGEHARAMLIAEAYGTRLGRGHLTDEEALPRLINKYPSHRFVIDRDEARDIFKTVRAPKKEEAELLTHMHDFVEGHVEAKAAYVVYIPDDEPGSPPAAESGEQPPPAGGGGQGPKPNAGPPSAGGSGKGMDQAGSGTPAAASGVPEH